MTHRYRHITFAVLLGLGLTACSGPSGRDTTSRTDIPEPPPLPTTIQHSDYESWDPAPYAPETLPDIPLITLAHDVPEVLMENRADAGVEIQVPGFRVQVLSTRQKVEADTEWENAITWWRGIADDQRPAGYFEDGLPVEVVYLQPYYRVRIGNFRTRDEAEAILPFLQRHFSGAFIIPDTIKLRR